MYFLFFYFLHLRGTCLLHRLLVAGWGLCPSSTSTPPARHHAFTTMPFCLSRRDRPPHDYMVVNVSVFVMLTTLKCVRFC